LGRILRRIMNMIVNRNMVTPDDVNEMFWDAFDRCVDEGAVPTMNKETLSEIVREFFDARDKFIDVGLKCIDRLTLGV
jgi:hypothetical protein